MSKHRIIAVSESYYWRIISCGKDFESYKLQCRLWPFWWTTISAINEASEAADWIKCLKLVQIGYF